MAELWKRIVFNIAISNTDDHLRNHGFLLTPSGWVLSPAYDLNPQPDGNGLALNISLEDNALDIHLAIEVSQYFQLGKDEATEMAQNLCQLISGSWETIAKGCGLNRGQIELMRPAFDASRWR